MGESERHSVVRGCGFALVLSVIGAMVGGFFGAQWYIHFGPPWAQYGYEFEGLIETLIGAGVGLFAGGLTGFLTGWRSHGAQER